MKRREDLPVVLTRNHSLKRVQNLVKTFRKFLILYWTPVCLWTMKKLQRGHCDKRRALILKISHRRKTKVRRNAAENIQSHNPNLGFERLEMLFREWKIINSDELCFSYHDQLVTFWLQAIFLKISFLLIEWKESTATGTSVVAEKILYEVALFCIWFYLETVLLGIRWWLVWAFAGRQYDREGPVFPIKKRRLFQVIR